MIWQDKEWIEKMAALEEEMGGVVAAGATPYNLAVCGLLGRPQLFMPVMDHEVVANLNRYERGWIVDRAFTFGICGGDDTLSLMGLAHVYPTRGPGLNTHLMRLADGLYWVQRYSMGGKGYYPFYVRPDQVVGAIPVNIEMEVGSTPCQSSRSLS